MNFFRKLLFRLKQYYNVKSSSPQEKKDSDDPANVLYETFEHGYKYPEVEIGCGINLMKHRNEL